MEEKKLPLLIIDKNGTMGVSLAKELQEHYLLVLVSAQEPPLHTNIIHIPYRKKIPLIPDNPYSHIFVFYNGEEEILAMLPTLAKKATDSQGKLLFITSLLYSSAPLFQRFSHHAYQRTQVLLYGETFSTHATDHTVLALFLQQARRYGKIVIPNDGIGKLYPIHTDDVLIGIIAVGFAQDHQVATVFLFPTQPYSEFSLARMLQKQNPSLKIDFKNYQGKPVTYYIPAEGTYLFPNYNLEEKLRLFDVSHTSEEKSVAVKKLVLPQRKNTTVHSGVFFLMIFLFIGLVLTLPVSLFGGTLLLQESLSQAEQGNFVSAKQSATIAKGFFITGKFFIPPVVPSVEKQLTLGITISSAEESLLEATILFKKITAGESDHPKDDFFQVVAITKNALIMLQKLKAEGELPDQLQGKFADVEGVMTPFANTIDAFPSLLGFEGKRQYLILFQNNMEIRPGGGFIGSYGLAQLENGKLVSFKVHDVYDADGKLTAHIDPPFGLRRYLGSSHLYLRDSNFGIDFVEDGKQAARLLQWETGEKVDGVLAVDTTFLRKLLMVMGKVTVPDYNETVTAENFYLITQAHAEKDFFPGSTQKKDFLRALLDAMIVKLQTGKDIAPTEFAKKVGESIVGKHLLFSFSDPAVQKLFTVNNLSGSLWDGRGRTLHTFTDFLGVVDANVGATKSNYYVKRSLRHDVAIDDKGMAQEAVTVSYTNSSTKDSPFGGDYKNFVQFVVPSNATVTSVAIDGSVRQTIPAITDPAIFSSPGFRQPAELELEEGIQGSKKVIGLFVLIPVATTKTITLSYQIQQAVDVTQPTLTYDAVIFKQPGTGDDPYSLFVTYPQSFQFISGTAGFSDVGGKVSYFTTLTQDKNIIAEFSKK